VHHIYLPNDILEPTNKPSQKLQSHLHSAYGANSFTTSIKGRTRILSLIKDSVAIPTGTGIGTGNGIVGSTRSTDLGNACTTIHAGGPNGRTVGFGRIIDQTAVAQYHGSTGAVHDGTTDAATLLDVVAGIEEGGGNVADEAGGDDHHGTAVLEGRANVVGEYGVDDVG